eukprot:1435729-Karenia_brevis.AAC.1
MKLVTRRQSRLERSKQIKKVSMKTNSESKETCKCDDKHCSQDKWIQPVEKEDPQRMILDFQGAEVSKPLLAVKRI